MELPTLTQKELGLNSESTCVRARRRRRMGDHREGPGGEGVGDHREGPRGEDGG